MDGKHEHCSIFFSRTNATRIGARWLLPILACALLVAPGWAQMGDRNTGTVCVYPANAFLHAGKGGRVLNVREAPFGAKGDGATDDTQAFIRAYDYVANLVRRHGIHDTRASFIIYIPEGTYLVSDTILYSGKLVDYAAVRPGYEGMAGTRFIGQNRERTIVKLKDHCPGFERGANKPVFQYAKTSFNNAETKSTFRNVTINTGAGNPGAIGLDFNGANANLVENVAIVSGDGQGAIGLHSRVDPTQAYYCDVTIDGFDYGVSVDPFHAHFQAFEHLTLRQQRVAGIRLIAGCAAVRDLRSENRVPALQQTTGAAYAILLDSALTGQGGGPALDIQAGEFFARNVDASGYAATLALAGKAVSRDAHITEYSKSTPIAPFSAAPEKDTSLNLPIRDMPAFEWPADKSQWANVDDFGATGDGTTDDAAAVQRAFDSGKPMIFFPKRTYLIGKTVSVPPSVRRVNMMYSSLKGPEFLFAVDRNAEAPLLFEDGVDILKLCAHAAPRTVCFKHIAASGTLYHNENTSGEPVIFVTACNGLGKPSNPIRHETAYCRVINTEFKQGPNFICDNATLWVFGYKVESYRENFVVKNGGRLEVLGGIANQTPFTKLTRRDEEFHPIIEVSDGSVSAILHATGHKKTTVGFTNVVANRQGGQSRMLTWEALPRRPGGDQPHSFVLPLYVCKRP